LRQVIDGRRAVFTLDNHLVEGGQGRMIAAAIAELGVGAQPIVRRFGLSDFPACGQNDEVLRAHGLDAKSLAATFLQALAN
jgi:transketolase